MSTALFVLSEPTILAPHEREPFDGDWRYRGGPLATPRDTRGCGAGRRSGGGCRRLARDAHAVAPSRVSRFLITPPTAAALTVSALGAWVRTRDVAITPDGTHVVYRGANGTALFVRALDRLDATPLTGLGSPNNPFVSPDGQWIGFADGGIFQKGRDHWRPAEHAGPRSAQSSAARPGLRTGRSCSRPRTQRPASSGSGGRWRAVSVDATRSSRAEKAITAGRNSCRAARRSCSRSPRRRWTGPGAGGSPRSADWQVQNADPGRQRRALCAEWASGVRRGRVLAGRRLRPRAARCCRHVRAGRAAGRDDGQRRGQCRDGGQRDARLGTGCRGLESLVRSSGSTGWERRRPLPRRRRMWDQPRIAPNGTRVALHSVDEGSHLAVGSGPRRARRA